jgi:hypothetical protein
MVKKRTPFKIGDKVIRNYDGALLTVIWSSKNPECRSDQLIATEANSYTNATSHASCFELAS